MSGSFECLGVPAAPVESQHELAAEALPERMAADERVELGDELRVAPEDQLRIDALLEAGEVLLSEPGFLQACERLLELGERRAAPQLQRSPEYRGRLSGPAGCQRLAPVRMELSKLRRSREWPSRSRR